MKMIKQSWEWIKLPEEPLKLIELAARTCYSSEDKITEHSAKKLVKTLLEKGHESVIEHAGASIKIVTNRGVTHELVRHRIANYSQESTRYVDYQDEMVFIEPVWWKESDKEQRGAFTAALLYSMLYYKQLRELGWASQKAREVLPNALKTEIVVTANLREWRHIFRLRTSSASHPQIRNLMIDILKGFKKKIPVVFDDID